MGTSMVWITLAMTTEMPTETVSHVKVIRTAQQSSLRIDIYIKSLTLGNTGNGNGNVNGVANTGDKNGNYNGNENTGNGNGNFNGDFNEGDENGGKNGNGLLYF